MVADSILAEWCRAAERAVKGGPVADFHRAGLVTDDDPSPEEIALATAEIRSKWSDEERTKRAGSMAPRPVVLPTASGDDLPDKWVLV